MGRVARGFRDGRVERVAMLSVHTCPLDQPGGGDSGGMNVTIRSVARRLARAGVRVDVFTRRAGAEQTIVEMDPGVRVVHLEAGPARPVEKEELPKYLCAFLCSLLRFEVEESARSRVEGPCYDLVHSHYWMSGWVGRLARERWGVPLVQTFHTLGKVKDGSRAPGDAPEPAIRTTAEERLVQAADCIIAPTVGEAAELASLYGARPDRVRILPPGVESRIFTPGDRGEARRALGFDRRPVILFVGRLQPLKAPDLALESLARLAARSPDLDSRLVVVGGPSGRGGFRSDALRARAEQLGLADRLQVVSPVPQEELVDYYRAADVVLVPSRSESFGLVALEAASCGTPVVASDVGGLRTTVRDGTTGFLVPPGEPESFASALERLLVDRPLRRHMADAGPRFAQRFDWDRTAESLLALYEDLVERADSRTELSG